MNDDISELFWSASVAEMKKGYVYREPTEEFICLVCGKAFVKGMVFAADGYFYEAEKYVRLHVAQEHTSMFASLLGMDKKLTGLTDLQKTLVQLFHEGMSDKEIVRELGGGSASTVRNHRFMLRERMKQAKVFLAIMELMEEKAAGNEKFISLHRTPVMLDERYAITERENEEILKAYFPNGPDGPLFSFPKKEKRKIVILRHIVRRFAIERRYTEKEVKEILQQIYPDDAVLRRYLVDYGFMDRYPDGSAYWVKLP